MLRSGRVHSIQVSDGGVPKHPVTRCQVGPLGLRGDRQADRKHHGGPDRAVSLWSLEVIAELAAEGHPVSPGVAGENITLSGFSWPSVVPGACLRIGREVRLEITDYVDPCRTIRGAFRDGGVSRIAQELHPGCARVYARVRQCGEVAVGDAAELELPAATLPAATDD